MLLLLLRWLGKELLPSQLLVPNQPLLLLQ
jgi:hypothetical protein